MKAAAIPPTATTGAATSISTTGATLNGTINANNASSTVTFEYGTTTSYGTSVTADQSPVTGSTTTSVSKAITGLIPNTTYHFRVDGVSTNGTTFGTDQTFTTTAAVPTATTSAATAITTIGATLNGNINANNASTVVSFDYGTTTSYGTNMTATQSLNRVNSQHNLSFQGKRGQHGRNNKRNRSDIYYNGIYIFGNHPGSFRYYNQRSYRERKHLCIGNFQPYSLWCMLEYKWNTNHFG